MIQHLVQASGGSDRSLWAQIWPAIPIAAIVTLVVTPFTAALVARRQELGKARAAAEVDIRSAVRSIRSVIIHVDAVSGMTVGLSGPAPELTADRIHEFAEDVVNAALSLSKGKQEKVRDLLVPLVGEGGVRMAEELGLAHAQFRNEDPHAIASRSRAGWVVRNLIPAQLGFRTGSLLLLAGAPNKALPEAAAHRARALRELDALVAELKAPVGLHGRRSLEWHAERATSQ
ncbi:hypothetical protein ACIRS1_11910 [Kitasatospora sp. NPDC101176]|uniref:hypothetical protein n=1 Tax=Kitasatospora sp. NPDC101176 TaxID=3364099 RepID=UPI00382240E7